MNKVIRPIMSDHSLSSSSPSLMEDLLEQIEKQDLEEKKWSNTSHFKQEFQEEETEEESMNNTNVQKKRKREDRDYDVIDLESELGHDKKRLKPSFDNPEFLIKEEEEKKCFKNTSNKKTPILVKKENEAEKENDQIVQLIHLQEDLKDCTEQLKELNDTFFRHQVKLDALNERMSDIINKIFEKLY